MAQSLDGAKANFPYLHVEHVTVVGCGLRTIHMGKQQWNCSEGRAEAEENPHVVHVQSTAATHTMQHHSWCSSRPIHIWSWQRQVGIDSCCKKVLPLFGSECFSHVDVVRLRLNARNDRIPCTNR